MHDESLTPIPDLAYHIDSSGPWIDLEQSAGCGEVSRITLHRIHLRLLFEEAGHLLPPTPADELSRRLARQLCELRMELANEYGRSPGINEVVTMLGAYCDALPDSVFPFDLFPDEAPELAIRQTETGRPDFQLTHPPKEPQQ